MIKQAGLLLLSPFEKRQVFHLNTLESPLPKYALRQVCLVVIDLVGLEIFKMYVFAIISP